MVGNWVVWVGGVEYSGVWVVVGIDWVIGIVLVVGYVGWCIGEYGFFFGVVDFGVDFVVFVEGEVGMVEYVDVFFFGG